MQHFKFFTESAKEKQRKKQRATTANWFAWNFPLLCLVFHSANVKQDVGFGENVFYYLQEVFPEWITLYHSVQNWCQASTCERMRAPVVMNEGRGMRTSCFLQRLCCSQSFHSKRHIGVHSTEVTQQPKTSPCVSLLLLSPHAELQYSAVSIQ